MENERTNKLDFKNKNEKELLIREIYLLEMFDPGPDVVPVNSIHV